MRTSDYLTNLTTTRSTLPLADDPDYYTPSSQSSLSTTSRLRTFLVGTGHDVFSALLPALEAAEHEVLFVTCFWARSPTLDALNHALIMLSRKALILGTIIRVRICFSSLSLLQKLLHVTDLRGREWGSEVWERALGLPAREELRGLDLRVKSVFVRPFSVMHPKFVVLDRRRVWLPSANVSWESWFEGGLEMEGEVVGRFVGFWERFWGRDEEVREVSGGQGMYDLPREVVRIGGPAMQVMELDASRVVQTVFLPSPHRRNPDFQPFAKQHAVRYPRTPLNSFLILLLNSAQNNVYMQTPNVTAPPVLSAILRALTRGVEVHIVTSERLMVLEQLVTGGTTTKRCLKKLVKRYKKQVKFVSQGDEEMGLRHPGRLHIDYFKPRTGKAAVDREPVQSHLKLTVVDDVWTVLGSGNMDRASWFTSQELGVAFEDEATARQILATVRSQVAGRHSVYYDSDT